MNLHEWEPYYPDGYPLRDGIHNPWVIVDPISGATAYRVWLAHRPIGEADFRRVLETLKAGTDA